MHLLKLENCQDSDAYLELGIKGVAPPPSAEPQPQLRSMATTVTQRGQQRDSVVVHGQDQVSILTEAIRLEQEKRDKL